MVIKPPDSLPLNYKDERWTFLAGSIEMGKAENWQERVIKLFNIYRFHGNYMNPRRDDWDSTWLQTIENPKFSQQVNWELDMLDKCDQIFMYFDPLTKSPITLLELGLYANSGKIEVVCPEGFWRRGNVEIICDRYKIPFYNSIEEYFK